MSIKKKIHQKLLNLEDPKQNYENRAFWTLKCCHNKTKTHRALFLYYFVSSSMSLCLDLHMIMSWSLCHHVWSLCPYVFIPVSLCPNICFHICVCCLLTVCLFSTFLLPQRWPHAWVKGHHRVHFNTWFNMKNTHRMLSVTQDIQSDIIITEIKPLTQFD